MAKVNGFKVFNEDWTCRDKTYECPGKFEEDVELELCGAGMHFCKRANDCFNYYNFDPRNHVCEVVAYGEVLEGEDKCCTDKLKIVREIPWSELLTIVNSGVNNSGLNNSGDRNSGDFNSGNRNSGNRNSGNFNSGNRNSGDFNSGDRNSGDFNKADRCTGVFCTENEPFRMFNKSTDWTYGDWRRSRAFDLLYWDLPRLEIVEWVSADSMSDDEKKAHPDYEVTGGYLKVLNIKESNQVWWESLSESDKKAILSLPNFDKAIFEDVLGIKIGNEEVGNE